MGCFLTLTKRDYAQLESTMRESISVAESATSGSVLIKVGPTGYATAREMAARIRQHAPSAQVTSSASQQQFRDTGERCAHKIKAMHVVNPLLGQIYEIALKSELKSEIGRLVHRRGKDGEKIAAQVLEQYQHLEIRREDIVEAQGVDIPALSRTGSRVVVEVKTSSSDKDFGKMMGKGYNHRQCSDEWLAHWGYDASKITVLGVHINPDTMTVSIYRRMDSDAKFWKCLARNMPLSDFEYDPDY